MKLVLLQLVICQYVTFNRPFSLLFLMSSVCSCDSLSLHLHNLAMSSLSSNLFVSLIFFSSSTSCSSASFSLASLANSSSFFFFSSSPWWHKPKRVRHDDVVAINLKHEINIYQYQYPIKWTVMIKKYRNYSVICSERNSQHTNVRIYRSIHYISNVHSNL